MSTTTKNKSDPAKNDPKKAPKETKTTVSAAAPKSASIFDKSEVYEQKILPKLEELADLCMVNRLPFFFACCVGNDKNGTMYRYDGNSPELLSLTINHNFFDKMLLIIHGFDVVPPAADVIDEDSVSDRAKRMMEDQEEDDEDEYSGKYEEEDE